VNPKGQRLDSAWSSGERSESEGPALVNDLRLLIGTWKDRGMDISPEADVLTLDTACPLDCPDGCSLTVKVRSGRLIAVDATPVERAVNPLTAGFICQKVKHHAERIYATERILTPLIRTGTKGAAQFREASWDEALDLLAGRMRASIDAYGPGSVLPYLYNSSAGVLNANSYGDRLCAELGLPVLEHTICAATNGAAKKRVLGGMISADPLDIDHAKYIVVWGANPTISNTHLPPIISRAVKQGAKLVVIDPRRTAMAGRADRHLAVRVGTDVVLASAIARHLRENDLLDQEFISAHSVGADAYLEACDEWTLDRAAQVTGLAATEIAAFTEEWATTRPATLRIGWGLERNLNGGSGIMTALALPVLMGHFGERGAGILHSTGSGNRIDLSALTDVSSEQPRRSVSQNDLGIVLNSDDDDQRIDVLLVQGANPALMNLDQNAVLAGLQREDLFTVVHEQVMTDTCRYADVVLPATTHFESADLVSAYGAFVVQNNHAVIERVGQSKSNAEFFAELAKRFGLHLDADPDHLLASARTDRPVGEPRHAGTTIQMVDVFPGHEDRRFHLVPPHYEEVATSDRYPLTLITPASNKLINSMFGERHRGSPTLHMHPEDAAMRTITNGQTVRLFNELATFTLTVSVTEEVRPGVVAVAKGYWIHSFDSENQGRGLNALIRRSVEPLAGGACFNDARVEILPFIND
jgi:anaerobic selenocysteine-containing dehydrogenase